MRFYHVFFFFLATAMAAPDTGTPALREPPTPRQALRSCCSSGTGGCFCDCVSGCVGARSCGEGSSGDQICH
ncbi:hypothetical protein Cob_v000421 [Colletotrichum orbiculare MAFF 240422]|uniref:Uncharacterized protein n=1 Tax=Colletotrichum orbiculare (strain 104-T / ATCC 96160 / CBS 514.97 / LARS 414 / MAFF 240422) TaxID=1213857 RepID=A0A484G7I1_COLOR|nr:hypothetical protein Cob_v000421 [Colletotrichum orbiculare MAFF 240422]